MESDVVLNTVNEMVYSWSWNSALGWIFAFVVFCGLVCAGYAVWNNKLIMFMYATIVCCVFTIISTGFFIAAGYTEEIQTISTFSNKVSDLIEFNIFNVIKQ